MKYLRVFFYIGFFVLLGVAIEYQKNVIQTKREAPVESVLSIMSEEGLPIKVYPVQKKTFVKNALYHLVPCGKAYCFDASLKEIKNLERGSFIRNPETFETIGRVVQISSTPSSFTGLYRVSVQVDKTPDRNLVMVDIKRLKDAVVAPLEAVIRLKGKAYVHVFSNGEVNRREVQLADISSDDVHIHKGLEPDEVIVVEGLSLINIFDKYKVVGEIDL